MLSPVILIDCGWRGESCFFKCIIRKRSGFASRLRAKLNAYVLYFRST
jgi:hypothetical protein